MLPKWCEYSLVRRASSSQMWGGSHFSLCK
jgi:hypothetical protein